MIRLLIAQLSSEFAALSFASVHNAFFAFDGEGIKWLEVAGDIMEIFAQVTIAISN
jgi:hypothetical protein